MAKTITSHMVQGSNALDFNYVSNNQAVIVEFPRTHIAVERKNVSTNRSSKQFSYSQFVFLNSLLTEGASGVSLNKATKPEIFIAYAVGITFAAIAMFVGVC